MVSERNLIHTIQELHDSGIRVVICSSFADDEFFFAFRLKIEDELQFERVKKAEELADAIHLKALNLYPQSHYATRNASEYSEDWREKLPEVNIPEGGTDPEKPVQIQIITGQPACRPGNLAMVLLNAPISNVRLAGTGEEVLAPAVQMPARQAMEVAMNMIHIAKWAETQAQGQEG